jgi:hypothetical protein
VRRRRTLEEAKALYLSRVERRGPDECWPYVHAEEVESSRKRLGHTMFHTGERSMPTSRFGYEVAFGPIGDDSLFVCHTCDHGWCQNPAHWFLGTQAQNMRDAAEKGRIITPDNRGARHGMAKLTEAQVEEIRARYARGDIRQRDLGAEYGIGQQQVSRILRGDSWGHQSIPSSSSSISA